MPPGIPVATVGINGAKNAGILAVSILAVGDEELVAKLRKYKSDLCDSVCDKAKSLEIMGHKEYLSSIVK
jgi:5-(carboxyamino)imidazole ribonucleotide mutase